MTSKVIYEGNLRTKMTHTYSGSEVLSDAPLDNQGLAQAFSPTDMVATSLASCMMTMMGIKARGMNIDLKGTEIEVTKVMVNDPRRIAEVHATVRFPKNDLSDKDRGVLENTARTCPVAKSLHPDIIQDMKFEW